jgi:hypothetical protein
LLVDNYLNDIILKQENKYISSRNIYDITSPARSNDLVLYSSNVRNGYFKKGEEEGRYETDEETDGKTDEEIDVENEEDVLEPGCVDEERYTANLSLSNDNTPFSVDQYKSTGSCCFNCIKFIIDTHTTETSITDIKQVLIDEYLKIEMPKTSLKITEGVGNNATEHNISDWKVFSFASWFNKNRPLANSVINLIGDNKDVEIASQINKESFVPTEFDLFLLFKKYKIPTIIMMKSGQSSSMNPEVSLFNTYEESDKEIYIIIVKKKISMRGFGLVKMANIYGISKSIINDKLLSGIKSVDRYIQETLELKIRNKEKKQKQNQKQYEKGRKSKIDKNKVKSKVKSKIVKSKVKSKIVKSKVKSKGKIVKKGSIRLPSK